MCVKVADEPFLESRDGDGPVGPASECESRILTVQVFVESDPLAAVGGVAGDFGGKVGVAEEGDELAFG
jgi:hypothetical protein